ncbi:MAG: DUF4406 domain-containing protein [Oscillospiraceae bacterium]|jgi:hypothetical protein|nr:DUF4406 domain-containing protein [Oscillospiraceae bacterium]
MTIYIAGKITGDPGYIRKFTDAQLKLMTYGYTVLSPSILPSSGFSYDAYIRMSEAMLVECDEVYFLNDWKESLGAQREHEIALKLGKIISYEKTTADYIGGAE